VGIGRTSTGPLELGAVAGGIGARGAGEGTVAGAGGGTAGAVPFSMFSSASSGLCAGGMGVVDGVEGVVVSEVVITPLGVVGRMT
jgi:hypothetical protein